MNIGIGKETLVSRNLEVKNAKNVQKAGNEVSNVQTSYVSNPGIFRSYVNFKGNAPEIKAATIVKSEGKDTNISRTENGGYIIEPETQTELIYGKDAVKYLSNNDEFKFDSQIVFPKKATGKLIIDNKEIDIKENSAIVINKGTKAKVVVTKGYPQLMMTKKEYNWYSKHSNIQHNPSLKDKFAEMMLKNSHTFNGEFKADLLSKDSEYSQKIISKLGEKGFTEDKGNGFFKFKTYPVWDYLKKELTEKGFDEKEMNTIEPMYKQIRQTKMDTKIALQEDKGFLTDRTVNKLKEYGLLHNNQKETDKIFWKTNYESENELRNVLNEKGITGYEQDTVINTWKRDNKIGYDLTGLKFINNNAAVYSLDDKLNNWSMTKTCWITNSTALASKKGTSSVGTSIVQANVDKPTSMSELRSGEHLHTHPGLKDKSQTEIYVVTSGSAALTIVKDGKPQIKVLREGEMAVIPPNTAHCVNSVTGEYEQVVSQVPSAFQYGLAFKENCEMPEGYTEEQMREEARIALS